MSSNNKREQILQYWYDKFVADGTFTTIKRLMPKFAELGSFSDPMLPLLAIVGKLPAPVSHKRAMSSADKDVFVSNMAVEFIVYFKDNVTPDTTLSTYADDVWRILHSDQRSGGLTITLTVTPEPFIGYWEPYVVFKMICSFQYSHTTGGI